MSTFDKYMFAKAGMKFYMKQCELLKEQIEVEKKVSKDLLFKNNKLTTENTRLKERLGNPVDKLERELFNEYPLTKKDAFETEKPKTKDSYYCNHLGVVFADFIINLFSKKDRAAS